MRLIGALALGWCLACSGNPATQPAPELNVSTNSRIRGTVNTGDGRVAPRAFVAAISKSTNRVEGPILASTLTDGGGRFELVLPRAGRYLVVAASRHGCGSTDTEPNAASVDIAITLRPGSRHVTGALGSSGNARLEDGIVRAVSYDKERDTCIAQVGSDGRFSLPLTDAHYLLVGQAKGHEYAVKQLGQKTEGPIPLTLRPRGELPDASAVTKWLGEHGVPVTTDDPRADLEDLGALADSMDGARIVAMGEATHGTREFFRLKHRFFRYLVEHHDFRVLAIEAGWPEATAIDEYVVSGTGDPRVALAGLHYWTWDTEEVVDLIQWMREYNANVERLEDKLRFVGFDMVFTNQAAAHVRGYLTRHNPPLAKDLDAALDVFGRDKRPDIEELLKPRAVPLAVQLERARSWVAEADTTDSSARAQVLHHLDILAQAEEFYRLEGVPATVVRDHAMAANVHWAIEQLGPRAKALVWGHNAHVSFDESSWEIPAMGSHLRRMYEEDFVAVGFVFGGGSFRAYDGREPDAPIDTVRSFEVGPPTTDSVAHVFTGVGKPFLWVDLRRASGPVAAWFAARHPMRSSSVVYRDEEGLYSRIAPARHFDALLYVHEMSPSTPTETGVRPHAN